MNIKYKRSPNASKNPFRRSNPSDAGADLVAAEDKIIPPLGRTTVGTGVFIEMPYGYYGRIAPRSGLANSHGINTLAGVIDSCYRGEIKVILHNTDSHEFFTVRMGDRIAQIIIEKHYNLEFVEVDELEDTERGKKGLGSTGIR